MLINNIRCINGHLLKIASKSRQTMKKLNNDFITRVWGVSAGEADGIRKTRTDTQPLHWTRMPPNKNTIEKSQEQNPNDQ